MSIQIVMAHPDDEIIFGWPILQHASSILICSNDKNNPDRAWCRYRYKALEEIGALLGIPVKSLDYGSEFYRLSARNGSLERWIKEVHSNIDPHADWIYTHNWMGEYGHLDHILVYLTMLKTGKKLMCSDIHQSSDWISFPDIPICGNPGRLMLSSISIDWELFNKCKAIYEKYGVWTWHQPIVSTCKIVSL